MVLWSASLATPRWVATTSRSRRWVGSGILFAYGDLNTLISEDEGGVGRCQLSVRHCECRVVCGLQGARKRSRVSREVVIDCRRCRGWRLVGDVRGGSPPPIFLCEPRRPENLFSAEFGTYLTQRPALAARLCLGARLLGWLAGWAKHRGPGAYRLACWQPHPELSPCQPAQPASCHLPPPAPGYRTGTVHSCLRTPLY